MGGGKGGGGGPSYDPALGQAYLNRYPDVYAAQVDPYQHYQSFGQAEGRVWGPEAISWPTPSLPDFSGMNQQSDAPSYEQQLADQERRMGESQRDELYSSYLDAANTATDYITNEVAQEQANARLLGIDYAMDDDIKAQRINDYFASVWGAGQQSQLDTLISNYGAPAGFEGFSITRGDASKYAPKEGSETSAGASKGLKPTLVTQEDEDVLGSQSILGA